MASGPTLDRLARRRSGPGRRRSGPGSSSRWRPPTGSATGARLRPHPGGRSPPRRQGDRHADEPVGRLRGRRATRTGTGTRPATSSQIREDRLLPRLGRRGRRPLPRRPDDPRLAAHQRGRGEAEPRRDRVQPERGRDPEVVRGRRLGARQVDRRRTTWSAWARSGGGQCGAQGAEYQDVHDVADDRPVRVPRLRAAAPIPGDEFNGLQVRIDQCNALDKPLFVGETGISPNDVGRHAPGAGGRLRRQARRPVRGRRRRRARVGVEQRSARRSTTTTSGRAIPCSAFSAATSLPPARAKLGSMPLQSAFRTQHQPVGADPRRPGHRAARHPRQPAAAGLEAVQRRAHGADAPRPPGGAAAAYEEHGPVFAIRIFHPIQRVHARAGGEPLHARHRPRQVRLARRQPRRPDPADRRRAADDRRRVPRPREADHDARSSTATTHRGDLGDDRGGRARRSTGWRAGDVGSTSTTGPATSRCGSRCGLSSASTPTRPGARRRGRVRARALLPRDRVRPPGAARAGQPVRSASAAPPDPRPDHPRRDRPPPAPATRATTSCDAPARRPTRTARASPTSRSATRR